MPNRDGVVTASDTNATVSSTVFVTAIEGFPGIRSLRVERLSGRPDGRHDPQTMRTTVSSRSPFTVEVGFHHYPIDTVSLGVAKSRMVLPGRSHLAELRCSGLIE